MNLARFAYLPDVTLGWLTIGPLRLATLERPWIPNPAGAGGMPFHSCVPDGLYVVAPYSSPKFASVFRLEGAAQGVYGDALPTGQTWGRTEVLIHAGNVVEDVVGCIAVGISHALAGSRYQTLRSQEALSALRLALGPIATTLTIKPTAGTSGE